MAPMKAMTLPTLELEAGLLAARQSFWPLTVTVIQVFMWTGSPSMF